MRKINPFHKLICLLSVIFCCATIHVSAQQYNTASFSYSATAKLNVANINTDWKPVLQNMEAPLPGGDNYRSFLLQQKAQLQSHHSNRTKTNDGVVNLGDADAPVVIAGFAANTFDGSVPTDNDVAVSNNNLLISVANSTIYMFDLNNDSLLKSISLEAFADTLGLAANMYDPKVRYDPKQDKFILVFLSGSSSSSTNIVVAFSETNNPTENWFLYALDGDPLQDSSWTDYPIVALTDDELFITANLLRDRLPSDPPFDAWKFTFRQSIIWQINKNSGYTGNTLQTKLYSSIQFNGQPIRNLCPIQGGSDTYGPNIYLLSNRNFDIVNDTFFILEITGKHDNPATELLIDFRRTNNPYGLAPDGKQFGVFNLMTNDSRVLGGYLENNKIHFVMNCVNPDTLRSGVYHGIVNNITETKVFTGNIIGDESLDFGYPNISYSGRHPGDEEAIITFNHTSSDSAAGVSALFYNGNTYGYSERITLKAGESYVNVVSGSSQRWGDYSGSQRKYNNPGEVWISGFYGARLTIPGLPGITRANLSWVGGLASPDSSMTASVKKLNRNTYMKVYPNPSSAIFYVEFDLETTSKLSIELFDASGKLIKTLFRDVAKKGKNVFSFDGHSLASGNYLLHISNGSDFQLSKNILKE